MDIKERVNAGLKTAMLAKDTASVEAYRNIKSAFMVLEKEDPSVNLTDGDYIMLLKKLAKKSSDAIVMWNEVSNADNVLKEQRELAIIESFIPKSMDESELADLVSEIMGELNVSSTDKKAMGTLVKETVSRASGRTDGKTVSTYLREKIFV